MQSAINVKIECVETGHQEIMSLAAFYKRFGRAEGKEILQGYCSTIVAYRTAEPVNDQMPNFLQSRD